MDILNSMGGMLQAVTNNSFLGKLSVMAGSFAAAYFTPIVGLLFACFACNIVDLFYGLKVARKYGFKLTSSKSWKGTLRKIRDEFTIITLSHILEYSVMGATGLTVLSGGATVLICLTELWSILENLNTIDPDGPWRALGAFLKKKGQDYTGLEIDLDKDGKINSVKPVICEGPYAETQEIDHGADFSPCDGVCCDGGCDCSPE